VKLRLLGFCTLILLFLRSRRQELEVLKSSILLLFLQKEKSRLLLEVLRAEDWQDWSYCLLDLLLEEERR